MMMWDLLPGLAQQGTDINRGYTTLFIVGMAGLLATAGVVGLLVRRRQRADRREFLALTEEEGFAPIDDRAELYRISENVKDVFRELTMSVRQVRIAGALSEQRRGFDIEMVHVIMGLEPSNVDHSTLDKMVLFVENFTQPLPRFSLMPNHFLFGQIQKQPVFSHSGWFGKKNLVLGADQARIAHVISPVARELLAENRDLVIESRGKQLAFFLHNEKVQPNDLKGFMDHCMDLAEEFAVRAEDWDETKRPPDPALVDDSMMPM